MIDIENIKLEKELKIKGKKFTIIDYNKKFILK